MAVSSISNVEITDTFQVWLNRTNDVIDVVRTKALTASVSNTDITVGNATLEGTFTANTIIAFNLLRADTFSSKTGGSSPVTFTSPMSANTGAAQTSLALTSSLGARASYNSPAVTWNTGFENTNTNAFIISTSTAVTPTVKITTAGEVIATKFTGVVDGTANTANRFATARSIGMTGDVVWNIAAFDGSTNVTATATIQTNVITNEKIRQSGSTSVVGRSAASTGNVADISASADGQILRRAAGVLGFGPIDLSNPNAVTGVLPSSNGGSGAASLPAGRVIFSTGSAFSSSANLFWDSTNSRLGIGTASPTVDLDVNGNLRVVSAATLGSISAGATSVTTFSASGTAYVGSTLSVQSSISANGNITAFTTVSPSDIRLKENVKTIESALTIVEDLRGVTFNWKDPGRGGKTYGLIAQEVEEVLPELVYDNGEFKGIAYANIVSVLIEAIKELKTEIDLLKG